MLLVPEHFDVEGKVIHELLLGNTNDLCQPAIERRMVELREGF